MASHYTWACVERTPQPIQFPAEGVKGYQPPCLWKRPRKMLTKPHEPAIKIEEKCIKNLGMKDVSVVTSIPALVRDHKQLLIEKICCGLQ